jgi:hypothetical protein
MLTGKDIRIGNLVEYNGSVCAVYGVTSPQPRNGVLDGKTVVDLVLDGIIGVDIDEITPIELTTDILEKFFPKGRKDFVYLYDGVGVQIMDDGYYIAIKDMTNVVFRSIKKIKYVHQLQNMYYDYSEGQELDTTKF